MNVYDVSKSHVHFYVDPRFLLEGLDLSPESTLFGDTETCNTGRTKRHVFFVFLKLKVNAKHLQKTANRISVHWNRSRQMWTLNLAQT